MDEEWSVGLFPLTWTGKPGPAIAFDKEPVTSSEPVEELVGALPFTALGLLSRMRKEVAVEPAFTGGGEFIRVDGGVTDSFWV